MKYVIGMSLFVLSQPLVVQAADPGAEVLAACYHHIEAQLLGDADRVATTIHPQLSARAVDVRPGRGPYAMVSETREELIESVRKGELKQPKSAWRHTCTLLAVERGIASVRLETAEFVSFDHYARFDDKWLLVDALWYYK